MGHHCSYWGEHDTRLCGDSRCAKRQANAARLKKLRIKGKQKLLRGEIQHRFPPGTLGFTETRADTFTVVGWVQSLVGWEAMVLTGGSLAMWYWTALSQCTTLEETTR